MANYRSAEPIARFVRDSLPFTFEPGNDLLGLNVHRHSDPGEQQRVVARVVQDLIGPGFRHHEVVVLTCHGAQRSVFSGLEQLGGLRLRRLNGSYDAAGNQVLTAGQLTFEGVYRFKGQEAPVRRSVARWARAADSRVVSAARCAGSSICWPWS